LQREHEEEEDDNDEDEEDEEEEEEDDDNLSSSLNLNIGQFSSALAQGAAAMVTPDVDAEEKSLVIDEEANQSDDSLLVGARNGNAHNEVDDEDDDLMSVSDISLNSSMNSVKSTTSSPTGKEDVAKI
jgi:hypothetical protein